MRIKRAVQDRSLWDRLKGNQGKNAPVTHSQPRQVSLKALPGPEEVLTIQGKPGRYVLKRIAHVMECGAEFCYLELTPFEIRGDPYAHRVLALIDRVYYES